MQQTQPYHPEAGHPLSAAPTASSSLHAEVLSLIRTYDASGDMDHQFTKGELAVCAAVALQQHSFSEDDISRYALLQFGRQAWKSSAIVKGFTTICDQLEAPLLHHSRQPRDSSAQKYSIDLPAARIFLDKRLGKARAGFFDLLKLPAELRTAIYEYALSYPSPEPGYNSNCFLAKPWLPETDEVNKGPRFLRFVRTPTLDKILTIVHVNKQVYQEALPVFFRGNKFDFNTTTLKQLTLMLTRSNSTVSPGRRALCPLEPVRSHHVTHLRLHYKRGDLRVIKTLPPALTELLRAERLRRHLTVEVNENEWRDYRSLYASSRRREWDHTSLFVLPAVSELVQLAAKAEHFELKGEGKSIHEYLRSELEKYKARNSQETGLSDRETEQAESVGA